MCIRDRGLNAFINAQGYAKMGMFTVAIGAICNIILDPIFIFQFSMGVKGAAVSYTHLDVYKRQFIRLSIND